jgi:hypothetical protein
MFLSEPTAGPIHSANDSIVTTFSIIIEYDALGPILDQ